MKPNIRNTARGNVTATFDHYFFVWTDSLLVLALSELARAASDKANVHSNYRNGITHIFMHVSSHRGRFSYNPVAGMLLGRADECNKNPDLLVIFSLYEHATAGTVKM